MEIRFKKLSENAAIPTKAHESDAGFDITATRATSEINECGQFVLVYHTDLAIEIPEGYVGLVFPRSSISKKSLYQCNSVGVIDSGYRGEIMVKYKNTTGDSVPAVYNIGDRIAQLIIMPYPDITFVESEELSESDRGDGGFGSTDKAEGKEQNVSSDKSTEDSDTV